MNNSSKETKLLSFKKMYWLVVLYASFVLMGMPYSILCGIWPSVAKYVNTSELNFGIITGVYLVFDVIFLTLASTILTKIGARITVAVGLALFVVGINIMAVADTFALYIVVAIILGMGIGLLDTTINFYISIYYSAKYIPWLHCVWGLGSAFGPFLMGIMLKNGLTYRQGYMIMLPFYVIMVVLIVISKVIDDKSRVDKTTGTMKVSGPPKFHYDKIFTTKNAILFFICMFLVDFVLNAVSTWHSTYLVSIKNISEIVAVNMVSVYFAGITISRMLVGLLVDKLGIRRMIMMGLMIFTIVALFLIFNIHSEMLLYIIIFMMGVGVAPTYPLLISFSKSIFDIDELQGVIGLAGSFAQSGSCIAALSIGAISGLCTMNSYVYVTIISGFVSIFAFSLLSKKVGKERDIHLQ